MAMNIVVLTGAGISVESGLRAFRGPDGLWEGHRIEDVCSPQGFSRDPDLVYDFYNARRRQLQEFDVQPNAAHLAVAKYEHEHPNGFLLITQNVDNLHERAGSKQMLHLHGELLSARCIDTGRTYPWRGDIDRFTPHPENPELKGRLRPDIVWFGEMPMHMSRAESALKKCDLFVAIGTSGNVYPAAGFVSQTPKSCRRVEINFADTEVSSSFDERLTGLATETVPAFFESLVQ